MAQAIQDLGFIVRQPLDCAGSFLLHICRFRTVHIDYPIGRLQPAENLRHYFIRREQIACQRKLTIAAGQLDEFAQRANRCARAPNLPVNAVESLQLAEKLGNEIIEVNCGVTFVQD